ncbi:MAG TPA: hypothetical protein PKA82_12190 [Pyrinomonadaceae bacterium]|nr:hypothetical protein [Pyrinomonadaceae bacterium]
MSTGSSGHAVDTRRTRGGHAADTRWTRGGHAADSSGRKKAAITDGF